MKYKICFEIDGLAEDDQGNPCAAALTIEMVSERDQKPTLEELRESTNIPGVLKMAFLDGIVDPADVRLISEEEYAEKYGEGEDDA